MKFTTRRKYFDQLVTLYNIQIAWNELCQDIEYRWWSFNYKLQFKYKLAKVCNFLTPYLNNARKFICCMENENSCKVLTDGITFTSIRNREADVKYYTISNWFGLVSVIEKQVISSKNGQPVNTFMQSVLLHEDGETYTEVKQVIFRQFIFTEKQLEKAKKDIIQLTPDLGWMYSEDVEEIEND